MDMERKTVYLGFQKNRAKDELPLFSKALEVLVGRAKKRRAKVPYVFYSQTGTEIDKNNLGRSFRTACKKAGIVNLTFHDLRHNAEFRIMPTSITRQWSEAPWLNLESA